MDEEIAAEAAIYAVACRFMNPAEAGLHNRHYIFVLRLREAS